jgi:uncharacterized lipoprotein YmbA
MRRILTTLVAASLLFLLGCFNLGKGTTQSANFYLLSSLHGPGGRAETVGVFQEGTIGVGPVEFPEYLNRPQIVTRTGPNQLRIDEFHRWGAPLKKNFSRVLAKNLSILLATDRIVAFPWRYASIDYQVEVEVTRFDGNLGEEAYLDARWTIFGKDGKSVLLMKKSNLSEPVARKDYETLVVAMSRLMDSLSREIATAFINLS